RKYRDHAEVSAGEKIENSQQRTADVSPNLLQAFLIEPGRGNVRAQTVNRQHAQRKKDAPAQVRHIEHIAYGCQEFFHNGLDFFSDHGYDAAGLLDFLASALCEAMR